MTRVEVSICRAALTKYKALPKYDGARWRDRLQAFLDRLVSNVLNNKSITKRVYRKMNVPQLLTAFGDRKFNIMVVGRSKSWMLNAHSVDRQHVIGSSIAYGYDHVLAHSYNWSRLLAFSKRFAAPGAKIQVYCLPYQEGS